MHKLLSNLSILIKISLLTVLQDMFCLFNQMDKMFSISEWSDAKTINIDPEKYFKSTTHS